jgi:hypothetical protein
LCSTHDLPHSSGDLRQRQRRAANVGEYQERLAPILAAPFEELLLHARLLRTQQFNELQRDLDDPLRAVGLRPVAQHDLAVGAITTRLIVIVPASRSTASSKASPQSSPRRRPQTRSTAVMA